jgi:flagellar protein FliO/FliZ
MFVQTIQILAALGVTLGLFGLCVWSLRKYGPNLTRRLAASRDNRRLAVIETLSLDPKSRLVLVRIDESERLVLIGDGRILDAPPRKSRS